MNALSRICIVAAVAAVLLPGCRREDPQPASGEPLTFGVRFLSGYADAVPDSSADAAVGAVSACRFEEGTLREILPGAASSEPGLYTFGATRAAGELRFVANGAELLASGTLQTGMTLDEFLDVVLPVGQLAADGLLMEGRLALDAETVGICDVALRRSVARVDLWTPDRGVRVHALTLRGMADRGYAFGRGTAETAPEAAATEFSRDYGEHPLENGREALLYLCEQSDARIEAEVLVEIDGVWHRLRAQLPATIGRNRLYTLRVQGLGTSASLTVTAGEWEAGGTADSELRPGAVIDAAASEIPADMRLNAACDTLYIPHTPGECRLVLRAEAGSELVVGGRVDRVSVVPTTLTRGLEPVAEVAIRTQLRMPGTVTEYMTLDLLRDGVAAGRVVLCFVANPVRLEGSLRFDDDGVCDYGRYVEGELGRLTLPAGRTLRLEFDGGESSWMKLVSDGDAWRLLGGWRPNDPTATGRVQEGTIVISDADGGHAERYVVRRRNWGLPVVRIGDTWWCKYNLRGDATRFEDQITAADDPAAAGELADYLASCDDVELLRLLGDQYQGGKTQGLPLRHNGEAFYYEGMASSGGNFGTLDPASMAPEGYRVPGYDDYAFLAGSENFNLGGVGERTYANMSGEKLTVRILERRATFLGHDYGPVALYEFRYGGEAWVLCGLGHQWNTAPGNISGMLLLLATWGSGSKTWVMEGYAQAAKPGQNWLKYVANNTTKTRTLRCVKTPVEYEYE